MKRGIRVHAPTATVDLLREAADILAKAAKKLPKERIFVPRKEKGERQPIALEGYVPVKDIADLVQYLGDMLEV